MNSEQRAKAKREYKEISRPMGIFQIKNEVTGKIFIGQSVDLDRIFNRHRFQLDGGGHPNYELQRDWKEYGESNFSYTVLETLKPLDAPSHDYSGELEVLEELWLEKLQPYGEKGYHHAKS
ncbi:MAG TPA: GIY-YIG nuclease family protein [Desulfobacteria bacterium]|nr:GIY-YIG nuclease family protein [Desulfobacteria bacterium]